MSIHWYFFLQGENMFIESLCQTILPMDDLLWVLNNPNVDNVYKKPFLACLHHVYLKNGSSGVETSAGEMPHHEQVSVYTSSVLRYFMLPRVLYLLNLCNLKLPKCNLYNVLDAHVHVHVVKGNCLFHFINVQSLSLSVNSTFWTNNQSTTQFPMSYYHDQFAQCICISIFPINYRFFMCFYTFISSFKV